MKLNFYDLKHGFELTLDLRSGTTELGRHTIENPELLSGHFSFRDGQISISDARVSRRHGTFSCDGKSLSYTDNSKNGTYVKRDEEIERMPSGVPHILSSGAELYLLPRETGYRYKILVE